jgi:hypothetical protein
MKVSRIIPIILVCLVLLVSCVYPNTTVLSTLTVTPASSLYTSELYSNASPTFSITPVSTNFQPSPTTSLQITPAEVTPAPPTNDRVPATYNLDATFNYSAHSLSVSEAISYMNYSPETILDLILMVEPNLWKGSFKLVSLAWEGGEIIDLYELNNDQMRIPLHQSLKSGGRLGLKIKYQLNIPQFALLSTMDRPLPYGFTNRQTNIVDWYPYIPPYRAGEGWLVHPHWGFGEHQVFDVADFKVRVTLAEPVQNLVIAASAPAEPSGASYSYHLKTARTFALSASAEYLVQTTTVGKVTINSYFFPKDKSGGQEVLHNTADALNLYSNLIMPYPHPTLSVVEADFLDGMEYDGLFFLSHSFFDLYDGTPKGYLTLIAAHETAHQWWYGLVGNDQALEPWLDEALCTYMERIFYEYVYPDYQPGSGIKLVDWWWNFRVNLYHPSGWVDSSIYDFNQFRPYRDTIYLNGAKFLEDLRNLIGDQAFFAFLRDYANKNAYNIATSTDFFTILRNHTSKILDGLVSNYFQNSK